jgi:putative ABC transport system permease protein
VNGKDWIIIGVLKNFHYEPVYKELEPLCMILPSTQSYPPRYMALKINSQNIENTLKYIREKWKDYAKDIPFEYSFFDDDFAKTYESVTQIKKIAFVFIILVIVISSLGLYALVAFITEKRTKEIGIRKVNGAKTGEIIKLIHRDFVLLVTLAFIFVSPVAWYAMQRWLQDFAYKTELSWWIFAVAGLIALMIAL